jgi:hypothetical protein
MDKCEKQNHDAVFKANDALQKAYDPVARLLLYEFQYRNLLRLAAVLEPNQYQQLLKYLDGRKRLVVRGSAEGGPFIVIELDAGHT